MNEFLFIVKTIVMTAVVVVMMQVRLGGSTLEERTLDYLENSQTAQWIQSAAAGGALMLTNLFQSVKNGMAKQFDSSPNHDRTDSHRATR